MKIFYCDLDPLPSAEQFAVPHPLGQLLNNSDITRVGLDLDSLTAAYQVIKNKYGDLRVKEEVIQKITDQDIDDLFTNNILKNNLGNPIKKEYFSDCSEIIISRFQDGRLSSTSRQHYTLLILIFSSLIKRKLIQTSDDKIIVTQTRDKAIMITSERGSISSPAYEKYINYIQIDVSSQACGNAYIYEVDNLEQTSIIIENIINGIGAKFYQAIIPPFLKILNNFQTQYANQLPDYGLNLLENLVLDLKKKLTTPTLIQGKDIASIKKIIDTTQKKIQDTYTQLQEEPYSTSPIKKTLFDLLRKIADLLKIALHYLTFKWADETSHWTKNMEEAKKKVSEKLGTLDNELKKLALSIELINHSQSPALRP